MRFTANTSVMKAFHVAIICAILAVSAVLAGCSTTPAKTGTSEMEAVAGELTASINDGLDDLKAGLKNTSDALSASGLSGSEAEAAMSENLLRYPWTLSSFTISRDGIVTAAAPKNYAGFAGTNLSWNSQFREANAKEAPMVSGVFSMVEGFTAVSQSYPIFSRSGEYLGYTDITYAPDVFLARQIEPVTNGTVYDVWVVQADGTEIYDTSKEEIGRNILTDPVYADPALQEVLTRIVREPSGNGTYTFWDREWNRNITKIAVWDTAGIDGAEWRVVITRADGDAGVKTIGTTTPAGLTTDVRYANLTRFVGDAAAYAQEHGKEAALREFNNPNGTFIEGDLYVFAYDMNGTVIALPYQRGMLGTDRAGISDSNGIEYIKGLIDVARDGGGSLYYIYPNPKDNYREEFKLSYVLPVDDEWFVGSGIYLPEMPAGFNTTDRDELALRVKQAQRYAQMNGAEKAIADFNDLNATFADGSRYVFAYGFNGTTLALPFQPDVIGVNRMNFIDTWGVKIIAWEVATAKRGGGFVYVSYLNPDTGKEGVKLCYVAPVDDAWLVGSGIYTDGL